MGGLRKMGLLLLAGLGLANSGCLFVAAGAAGAGAATYFYVRGRLCQEYYAGFADSWQAVLTALKEQGYPVTHQENNGNQGTLKSKTSDGSTITISLITQASRAPAEKFVTRVCVRVGVFGDEPLSERILRQIDAHLVPTGTQPQIPTTTSIPSDNTVRPASWATPGETAPPPELPKDSLPIGQR